MIKFNFKERIRKGESLGFFNIVKWIIGVFFFRRESWGYIKLNGVIDVYSRVFMNFRERIIVVLI